MKKLILISIALFVSAEYLAAQPYDYIIRYNYFLQTDSADKNSVHSQEMLLLHNAQKSLFVSNRKLRLDTAGKYFNYNFEEMGKFRKILPKDKAHFLIEKDFSASSGYYYEEVFLTTYRNKFDTRLNYRLLQADTLIAGYRCKKARTHYGGRNYTLYYTEELPLQDGPYKFLGLPGLVLEAFDDQNHHHFKIAKIDKQTLNYEPNYGQKIIDASMMQIEKVRKNGLKNLKNSNFTFTVSPEVQKQTNDKLKRKNNHIERISE